jgi:hypothetical protein
LPALVRSGASSLIWRRARDLDLPDSAALQLRDAYRYDTLQAAVHESRIGGTFALLRDVGIEPILVKGWAVARLYPEVGLRPYEDIDLCVRPAEHARAAAALSGREEETGIVDLHKGLPELHRESLQMVYDRSQTRRLGDVAVRILGDEDHLRYMCIHMLRHGAYRGLWLCDVGVVLESVGEGFDWDYVVAGNRPQASWVRCTALLAHRLLGASLDRTPIDGAADDLPGWLAPAVLKQWGAREHYMGSSTMAAAFRNPAGLARALRLRWPNPIQATVGVGGSFNEFPRLPYQLGECVLRSAHFITQVPRLLRRQSAGPVGRGEHHPVTGPQRGGSSGN